MTNEEAKKIGATHYYIDYRSFKTYFFKCVGGKIFMWNDVKKWFSESSCCVALKPL